MGNGNWEAYRLRSIFIVPTVSQHICFNILVDFDVVDKLFLTSSKRFNCL